MKNKNKNLLTWHDGTQLQAQTKAQKGGMGDRLTLLLSELCIYTEQLHMERQWETRPQWHCLPDTVIG